MITIQCTLTNVVDNKRNDYVTVIKKIRLHSQFMASIISLRGYDDLLDDEKEVIDDCLDLIRKEIDAIKQQIQ